MKIRLFLSKVALVALITTLMSSFGFSQTVPYSFTNSSTFTDANVYVAVVGIQNGAHVWINCKTSAVLPMSSSYNTVLGPTIGGNTGPGANSMYAACFTKLSEVPNKTINIPLIAGCRIFVSFNSQLFLYFFGSTGAPSGYAAPNLANSTDPNQGIRFEMIELTYATNGLWTNTTRVDAYQYPMGLEVWGNNSFYKKVGELKTHDQIIAQWQSQAPSQFQGCLNTTTRIIQFPSKTASFQAGGANVNYFQTYIDQIWSKYTTADLVFNSGDAGVWRGRVSGQVFTFTRASDGQVATIPRKPTTLEAMEGSGAFATGAQWDLVVQAQMCAAVNRHALDLNVAGGVQQDWSNAANYYVTSPYNWYSKFWHQADISFNSLTYAFCYDDVFDKSSTINCPSPTSAKVTIGGFAGTTTTVPVTGVTMSPTTASLAVNGTIQLTATVAPSNATNKTVSWSSSNTAVATVSTTGLVTARAAGTATITVTTADQARTATCAVTVTTSAVNVTGVTVSPTSASNAAGTTRQLTATVNPSNATDKTVTWTSSNTGVATVNSSGLVTAIAVGSATITVRTNNGGFTATCAMTVTGGTTTGTDITNLGGTITTQYTGSPANEGIAMIIDNNSNTKFLTFYASAWVQYQAPSSYVVTSYSITSANDAAERDPLNWTLQGSTNGTTWTTINTQTGQDFATRLLKRTFSFSNTTAYNYYRFNFTNNSGTILQVAEVELFGTAVSTGFTTTIQAESYSAMAGVATETTTDAGGGLNVGWIEANDWMAYPAVTIPAAGTYTIEYRVASMSGGGSIRFELAGGSPVFGTIAVPSTGGWQTWTTIKHTVTLSAGSQSFAIVAAAGGFNINWFAITQGVKAAESQEELSNTSFDVSIYPNPANEVLYILPVGIEGNLNVKVYNTSGALQLESLIEGENTLDVSNLQSGVYILRVSDQNNMVSKLFVKE